MTEELTKSLLAIAAIVGPVVAWFGKDFFAWWTKSKAEQIQQDDKIVERRSTRIDNEIERALKLKDETIALLREQLSGKNTELAEYKKEVSLCRGEKENFAKIHGEQAVALAETKAALQRAIADVADVEVDKQRLLAELSLRDRRIETLTAAHTGVRELVTKLEAADPKPQPAP